MKAEININKVMANTMMRVNIKGLKTHRIRMFIGIKLLKFAVWVIGCKNCNCDLK